MNGTLGVVNPETGLLEVKAACGSLKEVYVPPLEKKDKGITRYVVNTGKPYLCQDVTECPYYLKSDSNTLSELCVPIKVGGQTIGDINLESAERKHFSLEHERLLTLFAVYAGAAIVMAQTRWTDELHTLLDIGQELLLISSINDRDDVLNRVISIAADTLPCKRINILLKDTTGKRIVLRATYGGRENFIGQQFYDLDVIDESGMKGEGLTGKVAAGSIEKIRTRAAREMKGEGWKGKYNRPDEGHDEPPGSVPMMILPLRTMNDIVGAIRFTRPSYRADRADGCFNDNDERFALAVAQLIAIAVEIARLFEEKQRGIAEAVHQFTGPLHTIKSNVDYLLDYPVDVTEQREILAEIQGDIVRSIEWMDRIALSEKLRSGYIPLEFQKVPLKNLINEIWNGYCKNAEERGVKFRCHCLPDLTVEVDAQMFREALSNLLSNALKFTPDNTYVIVRAQQMEDNVEIKVFDQGPGLSSEAMERCFELYFSTVPPSGKREGQGLGLFIAQRIVHLHKGNLHASNKNKGRPGAVFTITLPQGDLKCQ